MHATTPQERSVFAKGMKCEPLVNGRSFLDHGRNESWRGDAQCRQGGSWTPRGMRRDKWQWDTMSKIRTDSWGGGGCLM